MNQALDYIAGQEWAITSEGLQRIIAIAERENLSVEEAFARRQGFEAIASQFGDKLIGTSRFSRTTVRKGVAIIPVKGPIFAYANFFNAISGATSLDTLSEDLRVALNSDDVRSILLYVDSPGGEVTGTNEFAKMVAIAATVKPVNAYVAGLAGSAAYWITTAANKIVADDTAQLGSIGVLAMIKEDTGKRESERGINTHRFISSQSPNKRPALGTEPGNAVIQKTVDDLAQVFVEAVAANRGVSVETVLSDFGQGGVLVGKVAVTAGLADEIGTFEGLFAEMSGGKMKRKRAAFAATTNLPSTGANGGQKTMSVKDKFLALLKGKGVEASDVEAQIDAILDEDNPAARLGEGTALIAGTIQPNAEVERLKADISALQATHREAKAEGFVEQQLSANKALPAESDAISALYVQASKDDDEAPLAEGSRVKLIEAAFEKRQAHKLTTEQMRGKLHVLPTADDEDKDVLADVEAAKKFAAQTNSKKAS